MRIDWKNDKTGFKQTVTHIKNKSIFLFLIIYNPVKP